MGYIFGNVASLRVIKFCSEEVEIQGDTPSHVFKMCRAWEIAADANEITPEFIKMIGYLVKPDMNSDYRVGPVMINWQVVGSPHSLIPKAMNDLFYPDTVKLLTPIEIFQMFETIHAFRDGNGRVGQIIYNWFNHTMEEPIRAVYEKR